MILELGPLALAAALIFHLKYAVSVHSLGRGLGLAKQRLPGARFRCSKQGACHMHAAGPLCILAHALKRPIKMS
eukprot:scaffold130188_cov28-Tisochrysis_lutea.AAC.6